MAINYANVEVSTDTFDNWVSRTNQLVTALRDRTLTANGSTVADHTNGYAELNGSFSTNTISVYANTSTGGLRGGNTLYSNVLYVVSNTVFTPNGVGNTTTFSLSSNSTASNLNITVGTTRAVGNIFVSGNSSIVAVSVTGNSTVTAAAINATSVTVTSNVTVNGAVHTITGNVNVDAGTLFVDGANNRVGINNTTPDASLTITGTANISGNTVIGGAVHSIAGNVAFDTNTLFVDATNNRVGIVNTTPDASLTVTGTANVSGNVTIGGLTSAVNINGSTINAIAVNVGANVNLSNTDIRVGNSTVNTVITSNTIDTDGRLIVLGNTTLSNTLSVAGLASLNDGLNTTTANATNQVNIGANVNLSTTEIRVGNSTSNSIVTGSSISTNGTLAVTGVTTLSSNVNVDGGTLFVDATNNRVGISNTTPGETLTVNGTANISGNTTLGGTVHSIAGNVAFDTSTLFVDSVNNRVGISNTTPDAPLTVTGAANVSGAVRIGGLTSAVNINGSTINATSINVGDNVNISITRINIGNSTINTAITSTSIDTDGSLAVLLGTTLSNTLSVAGLANLTAGVNTTTVNANSGVNIGANVNLSTTEIRVGNATSNSIITGSSISTNGTLAVTGITTLSSNVNVDGGVLFVDAANNRVGINNTTPDASLTITGTANISGDLRIGGTATIANLAISAITIGGAANLQSTLTVNGAATFANSVGITGLTSVGSINSSGTANLNTTNISGAANVANTLNVTGLTTLATANVTSTAFLRGTSTVNGAFTVANTITVTGTADLNSTTTFKTDYVVDVTANGNIGTGNVVVYTFPKATYSSAKFMVQAKNTGNTQFSEMIVVHDNTTAIGTTYGTITSPVGTGFVDMSSAINNANVEITMVQIGVSNSAIKIVAHLIK
jgi:hypothetical protein